MPLTDPCPACGKVCFTYAEARAAAKRANRRHDLDYRGATAEAYRCKQGTSYWHWGHNPTQKKPQRATKRKRHPK